MNFKEYLKRLIKIDTIVLMMMFIISIILVSFIIQFITEYVFLLMIVVCLLSPYIAKQLGQKL